MRKTLFLFIIACALSTNALAKKATPAKAEPVRDQQVLVPLAGNPALRSTLALKAKEDSADHHPLGGSQAIALSYSNWEPTGIATTSHASSTGNFRSAGLPYVSATYLSPAIFQGRAGEICIRSGAGVMNVNRSGVIQNAASQEVRDQNGLLIPVELGLEIRPSFLQWHSVGFHLDLGALPTIFGTSHSALDDGATDFGVGARAAAGFLVRLVNLGESHSLSLQLDAIATRGKLAEGRMDDEAAQVGLRFAL